MNLKLQGKRALVTGGSAGIGLAITKALVAEGVSVVVPGRNEEKLKAGLEAFGNAVQPVVADAATTDGVEAIIAAVPEVDILINNLGIYEPKAFAEISDEVESLRKRGKSDEDIAEIIRANSSIDITPAELAENYATPEERRHRGE